MILWEPVSALRNVGCTHLHNFHYYNTYNPKTSGDCLIDLESADSDIGLCGWLLVLFSILLTIMTLPISIWMCIKVTGTVVYDYVLCMIIYDYDCVGSPSCCVAETLTENPASVFLHHLITATVFYILCFMRNEKSKCFIVTFC